ncbi:MAG TPA: hypothetical protein PLV25_05505 [Opitutales bacterium]|nr:hypothetical protein [Opitutales bacterium]
MNNTSPQSSSQSLNDDAQSSETLKQRMFGLKNEVRILEGIFNEIENSKEFQGLRNIEEALKFSDEIEAQKPKGPKVTKHKAKKLPASNKKLSV